MTFAKKSLGQHFLVNQGVIEKIADRIVWHSKTLGIQQVVEIGPGRGALTREILKRGLNCAVIEKDSSLKEFLLNEFGPYDGFRFFSGDVLDSSNALEQWLKSESAPRKYIVCGNLPYNIGTEIVFHFFEQHPAAKAFVFMLQKEVVKRFVSSGNEADFGPIAVKMMMSALVGEVFWVKPGSFNPPPKVDSGVFDFTRNPTPPLNAHATLRDMSYDQIARFAKEIFKHRRKMMRAIDPRFKNTELAEKRPQELSLEDFCKWGLDSNNVR
jgi:16S rRNA (adenine1518-N6/adenine1519-N6)-dimethyltransferase